MLNKMHWMGNSVKILDSNVLYSRIALDSKMVVLYRGTWRSLDYRIWSSYHPHKQCCNNGNAEQELLRMYACIDRKEAAGSTSSTSSGNGSEEDDDWTQMFGRCLIWGFVSCAMLLLENQIPFFVLDKLFMQLRTDPGKSIDIPIACHDVLHLLHLFHRSVGLPEEEVVPAGTQCPCQSSRSGYLVPGIFRKLALSSGLGMLPDPYCQTRASLM